MKRLAAAGALALFASESWSHAFDDRYDLPAPLSYFVTGATAAVALSFVVTAWAGRAAPSPIAVRDLRVGRWLAALSLTTRILSVLLLGLVIASGLYGTRDPVMNLAPTLVWIVFWGGLSLVVACLGNVWPALDPWRALHDLLDALSRRVGCKRGATLDWRYPQALGAWPAVAFLLAIAWIEVVYPEGADPYHLARLVVLWTAVTLAGRIAFGAEAWERHGDVFALYFALLGRFAPLASGTTRGHIVVRAPGRALGETPASSYAVVAFILAMLSTVLFDGLLSGEAWPAFANLLTRTAPALAHSRGYGVGTVGLLGVWLAFIASYALACALAARLTRPVRSAAYGLALAPALLPISIAYAVAHNLSSLLIQGQQLIPLLSDPLGMRWNLFGTADYVTRIGLIDAATTWYVAIAAIVAGHVLSVWLTHRIAYRLTGSHRGAVRACVPLTVLMLAYTAISLAIIAEPMVKFGDPSEAAMIDPAYAGRVAWSASAWTTRGASIGC